MLDKSNIPLRLFETIDSTQDEAKRLLAAGLIAPLWVVSKEQTKGRGRSGHQWQSQKGNFSGTLIWPMPKNRADAPKFSMIAAHALYQSLSHLGLTDIDVKWPNDVLIERKKLAGILVEAEGDFLLIGTGVNLVQAPAELADNKRALQSMALSSKVEIGFEEFFEIYKAKLVTAIDGFESHGFAHIAHALQSRLLVREDMILDDGVFEKLVRPIGLGENGQLIVESDSVTREIYAGDLYFSEGN